MQSKLFSRWQDWPAAEWHWPHFTAAELACHGDGSLMLDTSALDQLEALRVYMGAPFVILSAYRSPAYNETVGGAPHSQHMQGRAFDVSMKNHDPHEFMTAARAFGFHGIGQYPTGGQAHATPFVHIDTRPDPAAWTIPPDARWPIFEDDPHPPQGHIPPAGQFAAPQPVGSSGATNGGILAEVAGAVLDIVKTEVEGAFIQKAGTTLAAKIRARAGL